MIIIVDGYNVLKQAVQQKVTEADRNRFIQQLGAYARIKEHHIIVVFDAGPFERPSQESAAGVTIVYSGQNSNADAWIEGYMHHKKGHELLLVSSDRQLCAAASELHVPSLDALPFYMLVKQATHKHNGPLGSASSAVKTSKQNNQDLDILMHDAARHISARTELEEDAAPPRKRGDATLSKKERGLLKKIKKL